MNERIYKLAEQVDCTIDGWGYGEGDIEGLAELIVRECANFVENIFDDDGGHAPCEDYAKGIKQHFGVEE